MTCKPRLQQPRALEREESYFRGDAAGAGEASHFSVRRDDAVAGNQERPRIRAQCGADGAAGARRLSKRGGDRAVGRRVACFHLKRRMENGAVELTDSGEIVGQIGEILQVAGQVALHAGYDGSDP